MVTRTVHGLAAKELALVSLFAAVTAVFTQIAIPLPFTPIPISFGLVAVYATGILLEPRHAVFAQLCYLLLGAAGVPVYANFRGGINALFGPTGGYLMVYPLMAGIVAMALNRYTTRQGNHKTHSPLVFVKAGVSMCAAHALLYAGGTLWFCATTGNPMQAALALTVYPFIPLDIVKILFCLLAVIPLRSRMLTAGLLIPKQTDYAHR